MAVEINPPFRVFTDVDGEPLEDGYIHIGAVNQNPQAVPISVFWDISLTIPAAQPIRTLGGYPSRAGTPSRVYVAETTHSISISNKNGTLIYSSLNSQSATDLEARLSASNGSQLVGYGAGTLEEYLDTTLTQAEIDAAISAAIASSEAIVSTTTLDGSGREVPVAQNYTKFDLQYHVRTKPPGMSWLPFDVIGLTPDGSVAISKTPEQVFNAIVTLSALTTEAYVDVSGGSDANNGSIGQPWASLAFALTQAPYVTKVAVGAYAPFATLDRALTSGNRARRIRGSGNPLTALTPDATKYTIVRATGDVLSAATWAISGSPAVNTTTLVTANGIVAITLANRQDEFGRPLPLTQRANANDVASMGGWFYDTGTKLLSVRYGTTANFDTNVKPNLHAIYNDATTNGYLRCEGAEVFFENVLFVGCFPQAIATAGGVPAKLVFKNCGFWFSRASAIINQGSLVYTDNCEIYRCQGDGVNSHSYLSVEADHIVANTKMNYCGDFDTVGGVGDSNQNGASIHENGRAAVIGGSIYKASGPGLIDTGSGPGSTGVSWWLGVDSRESLSSAGCNFESFGVRTVWMESCSESGDQAVPVRAAETGTIIRYAQNSVRGYTASSGGLVVAYDPLNPV